MYKVSVFRDCWESWSLRQGIALQLLDNTLPDDFSCWPEAQRQSAKSVLLILLEKFNIRHNDIRGANFGLDRASKCFDVRFRGHDEYEPCQ